MSKIEIPEDDWFARCYGTELGAVAEKLRRDFEESTRWTWQDYVRIMWSWTYALVRVGAAFWLIFMIVNYLQSHC